MSDTRSAEMRLYRYQTVQHIAAVAAEHKVDFVLVAGDVLDDNALGLDALQQASDALTAFGPIPVFLLPGNHDAATADSALARLTLPPNVRVLTTREAVVVPGGRLWPCPLMRRHEIDDPTAWLPSREQGEGIRIAMAHGGVIDFAQSSESETKNLIDADRVLSAGFDYLALGDWHGLLKFRERAWYSGAHEPTRFKEINPGHVLIVEIDEPGSVPQVEAVKVAQTEWITIEREFSSDAEVDVLKAELEALPNKSKTLVNLRVSGAISMGACDRLERLVEDYAERLVYLRSDLDQVQSAPSEDDLTAMSGEGFIAEALDQLRSGANPADDDAMRLMYRLQTQIQVEGAHANR
jgi:DNA repair exonuclease SbcCD nuclease subunit